MTSLDQLIVTWQDPSSRRYFPVGRLSRVEGRNGAIYLFVYTKGIAEASEHGFQPFPAFPDDNKPYRGAELFPFFANRLVPESRDDRRDFITSLGLDPDTASPLEVLARSGGRRATDSVEILAIPRSDAEGTYLTYFFLSHGLRHMPEFAEGLAKQLSSGDRLYIMHDLQNPVDPRALLLRTEDNCPVGFLPRPLLDDTWKLLDRKEEVAVFVERVNPPPLPIQQRVLCKMQVTAPDGFSPCSGEACQPRSTSGTED